MCGIAGIWQREGRVEVGRLRHMSHLLRHRGPDDEGIALFDPEGRASLTLPGPDTPAAVLASSERYSPGRWEGSAAGSRFASTERMRVGLVNRRLAILDLSPAGHGPMCDADGENWITFSGEVYNYIEIRRELEAEGMRFHTGTDTEVVLAAYRRDGPACLRRFNGMYAFALWDTRQKRLFCARDRFGVKPFYYQWDGSTFAFASEPKALVLTQERRPKPRAAAIRDLLALDWVDHGNGTFFEGLVQLPAAHYLLVEDGGFSLNRYWGLDPEARATGGPEDWRREFERLFTDAVTLRLTRADVEVGSCLSGGVDSSAVVTTAVRASDRPLHTFTCAYDEGPAFDERPHVRAVAQATGAISKVTVPDGGDLWAVIDRLTEAQDEPTAGSGLYSQWKVMELAHGAGLKVLLDGQGGDETLAGYFRYLPLRLRDHLTNGDWPAFARGFGPVADRLGVATTLGFVAEPWVPRGLAAALRRRHGQGKDRVLGAALRAMRHEPPPRPPRGFPSALSRQLAFDTLERLLPSLLRYEDRNSMAFSIETRLPFLDYRLVEFVFSLPDDRKIDGTTTKAILRESLADRLPVSVAARRDKLGFETPTDLWFRGKHSAELVRRLGATGPLHDWLDARELEAQVGEFLTGRRAIGLQVWRWLSLESWLRRFVSQDPRVTARPGEAVANGRADAFRTGHRVAVR